MNIQKNITKLPKAQVEIQVTVPWTDIEVKWNETLAKLAQEVELPGFRKGQAPLNLVEQNLGRKLEDEVFKVVMPQAVIEALQGSDVIPIDYPNYQVTSFQKGGQLQFNAKITERPKITIGDYKSIRAVRPPLKQVADADVEKIITDLFNRWKLRNPAPAGTGQVPAASPSTTSVSSGAASGGSLSFNQTTQSSNGPDQPVSSPVASDAPASPTGGQDGPDDNFAKAVGAQNLADLRSQIRKDLEDRAKLDNELDYEEEILQQVEKITTVDIPDILIQDELNRMLISLQRNVTERGMLMDDYLKAQQKTVESLKSEWQAQAERNVKMELGLSEIARVEGVNISDEELQVEIDKIQDARIKAQFAAQEPRMQMRHSMRQMKTLNLLKSIVGQA